jgi:alpha-methylacyl-CoA racemase
MLLAFGVVCALLEARSSGRGQVIDAAMVDGAALLTAVFYGLVADGSWKDERGSNLIDGGAHMYGVYETADHEYISIGALEPQFYAQLLAIIGLSEDKAPRMDRDQWPQLRTKMAEIFRTKTRDQWSELLEGTDACFAPVLSFHEATLHPHNRERQTFVDIDGLSQPAPAPRFSRTPAKIAGPPHRAGQDTESVFADWGFDNAEIQRLKDAGAVA